MKMRDVNLDYVQLLFFYPTLCLILFQLFSLDVRCFHLCDFYQREKAVIDSACKDI